MQGELVVALEEIKDCHHSCVFFYCVPDHVGGGEGMHQSQHLRVETGVVNDKPQGVGVLLGDKGRLGTVVRWSRRPLDDSRGQHSIYHGFGPPSEHPHPMGSMDGLRQADMAPYPRGLLRETGGPHYVVRQEMPQSGG